MPLFSIVTVCKNDLDNLKKTVESIQIQSFLDYEYIIIDGASTDGSVEYIKQIDVDVFVSEPDNGIFYAMNKALRLCSGKYVCFMNAGDFFYDKYVLEAVAKEALKYPDIQFFYGDVICPNQPRYYMRHPHKISSFLAYRTTICHQAWFLSRDIYNEIGGFDESLRFKGDYDVFIKINIMRKVNYRHLPICVAIYKGGGWSLSNINAGNAEQNTLRKKYFKSNQIFCFSVCVKMIEIARKIPLYENIMSIFTKLYCLNLRRIKYRNKAKFVYNRKI